MAIGTKSLRHAVPVAFSKYDDNWFRRLADIFECVSKAWSDTRSHSAVVVQKLPATFWCITLVRSVSRVVYQATVDPDHSIYNRCVLLPVILRIRARELTYGNCGVCVVLNGIG